ncbi:MAG: hypothetical protein SGPRY_012276 [Prymnesium sp.]
MVPGRFKPTNGTDKCLPCAAGYFASREGSTECNACEASTYQDKEGDAGCKLCSVRTNSTQGATTCGVCAQGFYRKHTGEGASDKTCNQCDASVDCPSNSTLSTLVLRIGYWRLSDKTKELEASTLSLCTCNSCFIDALQPFSSLTTELSIVEHSRNLLYWLLSSTFVPSH